MEDLASCQPGHQNKGKRGRGNRRGQGPGNQPPPPTTTYPDSSQWAPKQAPAAAAGPAQMTGQFGQQFDSPEMYQPQVQGLAPKGPAGPNAGGPASFIPNAYASPECFTIMHHGNCPVDRIVYYYDMKIQSCKPFWYGCNGNENRFDTYYSCMDNCAPIPQFPMPKQPVIAPMHRQMMTG